MGYRLTQCSSSLSYKPSVLAPYASFVKKILTAPMSALPVLFSSGSSYDIQYRGFLVPRVMHRVWSVCGFLRYRLNEMCESCMM